MPNLKETPGRNENLRERLCLLSDIWAPWLCKKVNKHFISNHPGNPMHTKHNLDERSKCDKPYKSLSCRVKLNMSYYFLCNVFYCCDMPAEHLQDEECTLFLHAQHFNEALNFGHYVLSRNSLGNNAKQYTNKCWNSTYSGNNLYWSLMASLPPSSEIYEKLIECHIMSPANVKVMMMILAWQWPIIPPTHTHTEQPTSQHAFFPLC